MGDDDKRLLLILPPRTNADWKASEDPTRRMDVRMDLYDNIIVKQHTGSLLFSLSFFCFTLSLTTFYDNSNSKTV